MPDRELPVKPKSPSRDFRLAARTLSSLAFPTSDNGSSWSLSMLKRVDRFDMIILVRKLSTVGSASDTSNSGSGSGSGSDFFLLHAFLFGRS